ncbi:SDR family oxidoreductase [Agrobacterium deltaense]|uniref:SDR family oxidoreductase n=1 Tax=Agrobacterium deltaense TaxID=1183412 RepID=UPI003CC9CB86
MNRSYLIHHTLRQAPLWLSGVANAAVFLASSEARYITGQTLNVDGGFLAAGLLFPFDPKRSTKLADEK